MSELKETRNLFNIIHKIKSNKACQAFESFIRTYYLSKKHSYLTVLREYVEELYNFSDEYIIPLNYGVIQNLYDNSAFLLRFYKANAYSIFPSSSRVEELEVNISNNKNHKSWLVYSLFFYIFSQIKNNFFF